MAKKKDKVIEMIDRYLDLLAKPKDERNQDEIEEMKKLDWFLTGGAAPWESNLQTTSTRL